MQYRELKVPGAWEITPQQFGDPRGVFLEWFKSPKFVAALGHELDLQQANCSVSAAGVLRGIHFADVPAGQAKYVTCVRGAVLDVVIDLRVGSPTFGQWDTVLLDDDKRRAIYLGEGLGHAFLSLEDDSTVVYLCSTGYAPEREHGIHPLDETVNIEWPKVGRGGEPLNIQLSEKDEIAPTLKEAQEQGLLPEFTVVNEYLAQLRAQHNG